MAFSKMAGFEVTPRSESSSTSRFSSPDSIMPRRIWSSQTLVPASVRVASRSLTPVAASMSGPRSYPLHDCFSALGHLLGGEAEVLVQVHLRSRRAEGLHADRLAVL